MKISNKLDNINILLIFFIGFLVTLFYYLNNIEKSITNYNKNHDSVVTLRLLNKEFNNFTFSINRFSNYDEINKTILNFKHILLELKENIIQSNSHDAIMLHKIEVIENIYKQKIDDIEYFKAMNSSALNSSHFLFDLQQSISDSKKISSHIKSLINETLFYTLKYTTSDYIDKKYILKKLQYINHITKKTDNGLIDTFYKHSVLMIDTIASLKQLSVEIKHLGLNKAIEVLRVALDAKYKNNLSNQKIIAVVFFILSIIVLVILILTHMQSLKTEKELLAFKYALQHSDNTIVITDPQRHIIFVNETFEKTTGYTKEEVLGKNPNLLKSGKQSKEFYKNMNEKLDNGQKWEGEFINKRKNGTLLYEKASIVPVFLNKKLTSYLAIKLDITKYIEQNKKLAQAASVFENTEEAIIITDKNAKVISINNAFTKIYGYTLEELRAKTLKVLHSGEYDNSFYKNMWNQINHHEVWKGKIINQTKNGEKIPVWVTIKQIKNKQGEIINYTSIQTDLRELEKSQQKADYLAYHDSLTGLYNRINFEEYLAHALLIAQRNNSMLGVLFIDLDRFKIINDTLGHNIGDEVLITVAKRLKKALRDSDFIARWGGDEFVVILENLSSSNDAANVAKNIIDTLKEPMNIDTHHLITTASIGIAFYPENGKDVNTLIKHADSAMYQAKDKGKNNFCYYTNALSQAVQNKLNIDIALHNALTNNEIYIVFQPQYDLKTNTIVSIEALIRWNNKELGLIPPDDFIPIAEDNGTIINIGYFVFEESCKAYQKMKNSGTELKYIAINVSSIQFKDANLLKTFLSISQKYELNPSEIEIEITERFIMEHTKSNMNLLQSFRNHGFKISIDDFGTGYSSMSYLKQLPIDTIKIDKSFIDDIKKGSPDNVIIEAITALSKTLGYQIVAEGIETQEQENFLKSISCDIGQGYLFSRPVSCEVIINKYSS